MSNLLSSHHLSCAHCHPLATMSYMTTATLDAAPTTTDHLAHGRVEDVFGLLSGTFVASLGIYLLHAAHVVTGTAGLGAADLVRHGVCSVVYIPTLLLGARAAARGLRCGRRCRYLVSCSPGAPLAMPADPQHPYAVRSTFSPASAC